jgi:ribosomal protein S12 methylthiotransferase
VGQVQPVLIEGYNDGISVGRAYHDAPEIDGMGFIEGQAEVGKILPVKITGAMVHDLTGQLKA